jgi:predicted metalloprotease
MQWRGRRTSDNIEDRRRAGPARAGGIGVVGLILVLLAGVFFGVDITPFLQGGGGMVQAPAPSGPNQIDDAEEEFVGVVLAETEDVWSAIFTQSGLDYAPPRLVLYAGGTVSACGAAQSAMGPFYCPNDQTVYLDTDFFRVMVQQLGADGEFAQAYVIAHEVGHHVQNLLGTLGQVNAQRSRVSRAESNALSVRVELQADCYSGIWAREVAEQLALTDADIRDALNTAARIGDDALQRAQGGRVVPDSFTHGTSEQRQRWFYEGFRSGDPQACDTFAARSL